MPSFREKFTQPVMKSVAVPEKFSVRRCEGVFGVPFSGYSPGVSMKYPARELNADFRELGYCRLYDDLVLVAQRGLVAAMSLDNRQ